MPPESHLSETKLAIAAWQLRAEVTFKNVKEILAKKNIKVLVLKGPHLANTVYDAPGDRPYGDLDILVSPPDFSAAADALLHNGYTPFIYADFTPEIQQDFKHWEFLSPWGLLVEVHRWLSGHDRYRVDSNGLFDRAVPFLFGETEALGLAGEDLLLHLCLHMGTSYFHAIERKHVLDIALLTGRQTVDWPVFLQRVKKASAKAIAYYSLLAARHLEGAVIADDVLRRLRPGKLRGWWLEKSINPASFPIYRFPEHGIKRIKMRLFLPLLDRPGQWIAVFGRMAVTKCRWVRRVIKGK
jgi:hypothetical protein